MHEMKTIGLFDRVNGDDVGVFERRCLTDHAGIIAAWRMDVKDLAGDNKFCSDMRSQCFDPHKIHTRREPRARSVATVDCFHVESSRSHG